MCPPSATALGFLLAASWLGLAMPLGPSDDEVDQGGVAPITAARRSGPREHGRQAARSERVRTGRAGEETMQASHASAGAAGALKNL
jgi:hypothetical protein